MDTSEEGDQALESLFIEITEELIKFSQSSALIPPSFGLLEQSSLTH